MRINQILENVAEAEPHRTAIHFNGIDVNYEDFLKSVNKLSHYYLGTKKNNPFHVLLISENSYGFASTFFALANVGASIVTISPFEEPAVISEAIQVNQITHVAVTGTHIQHVRMTLRSAWLSEMPVIEIDRINHGKFSDRFKLPPEKIPKHQEPFLYVRTQGTVFPPTYVGLSHYQIEMNLNALRAPYDFKKSDRFFTTMHWSHPFALTHGFLLPLLHGGTCVVDPGLDGPGLIKFLKNTHITRMSGVPSFFFNLLVNCRNERYTLPDIKSVTVGLGTLSPPLRKTFGLLKIPAIHCYGQAEHVWTVAMEEVATANMMGGLKMKGLPGFRYRVVDQDGNEIRKGGRRDGILAVSSPSIMSGYRVPPPKSKEDAASRKIRKTDSVKQGKWLITADAASIEGDATEASVAFLGRRENCLYIGNRLSALFAVDAVLKGYEGITESFTYPSRNHDNELEITCSIVRHESSTINEGGIVAHLKKNIPPEQIPTHFRFIETLPKDFGGNPILPLENTR